MVKPLHKTLPTKSFFCEKYVFYVGQFCGWKQTRFCTTESRLPNNTKDAALIELKTWKYAWSLGIPYDDSFEAPEEKFPGYIREFGFALAYQRFLYKGLYTAVHVMNAHQSFFNDKGDKIATGYQMFNTYRLGVSV